MFSKRFLLHLKNRTPTSQTSGKLTLVNLFSFYRANCAQLAETLVQKNPKFVGQEQTFLTGDVWVTRAIGIATSGRYF
jgi:hypothetical protein